MLAAGFTYADLVDEDEEDDVELRAAVREARRRQFGGNGGANDYDGDYDDDYDGSGRRASGGSGGRCRVVRRTRAGGGRKSFVREELDEDGRHVAIRADVEGKCCFCNATR
jgi:hypothetical protein